MTGSDEKAVQRSSAACCVRSGSWVSGGRLTVRKEMGSLQLEVILVLDSAIACAAGRALLHICLGCGWDS